jgi:hypothetical protein
LQRTALPKVVVLKARQLGCSTLTQSYAWYLASRYGYSVLTLAHARLLYHRFSRRWYFEQLEAEAKAAGKKLRIARSQGRWNTQSELDLDSGGRIVVRTAAGRGVGHSQTFQFLHLSEASRYPDAEETLKGVLGAATHAGAVVESTANGMSGNGRWFYEFWSDSVAGKTGYEPIFLPWYIEHAYRTDHATAPLGPRSLDDLTESEIDLLAHGLDLDQFAWRRAQIAGPLCAGDPTKFKEQFPSSPHEAFAFSGLPLFPREQAQELLEITRGTPGMPDGYAKVWETPRRNENYILGVDVGEGVGRDKSVIQIISRTDPPRQCLEWVSDSVDPVGLSVFVANLASIYNRAIVNIEINNHGLTTMTKLQDLGGVNLYIRQQWDRIGKVVVDRPGWKTTTITKPILIDALRIRIIKCNSGIRSQALAEEILSYIPEQDARIGGSHYDRMIAYCLALIALDQRGTSTSHQEDEPLPGPQTFGQVWRAQLERRPRDMFDW